MAEWLYEAGIGENRAALVEDGEIVAGRIEPENPYPRRGAVHRAHFLAPLVGVRSALIKLDSGIEAMLQPVPDRIGPGSRFVVEITHEFFGDKQIKARIVPDETSLRPGPTLLERLTTGHPVKKLHPFQPDELEAAGWSELLEEAATGKMAFPGGSLWIETTQAMTLIDVDGILEPAFLAVDGARAAGRAISRMGLGGSIGIDLPTVSDRAVRKRAGEALDAQMIEPFERTAVNGFGFLQVVMRRQRPSLLDLMQGNPPMAAALALYRRAARDPWHGPIAIVASPAVVNSSGACAGHDRELERRRGAAVEWRSDPSLPIWGGHIQRIDPNLDDDDDSDAE